MMYHSFSLSCFDIIRDYTKEYMDTFSGENFYIKNIPISNDIRTMLDNELANYGITYPILHFLCFKRKNKKNTQVHIDYSSSTDEIHASLVIPVEGCAGTGMYWMSGQHKLVTKKTDSGETYLSIQWLQVPILIDEVEINSEPMLCRVDVPHSAYSNDLGDYRTILSIRFVGNPSIEELVKLRFNK
jgi:hypothetical protein